MNNKLESVNMRSRCALALVWVLGVAAPGWSHAENLIRSITGSQQGGGEVVRVELSEPLALNASPYSAAFSPDVAARAGKSWMDFAP